MSNTPRPDTNTSSSIITFNIQGLPSKLQELRQFAATHSPIIIGLSETLIRHRNGLRGLYNIPNYTAIRKDRELGASQGIALYYRKDLSVEEIDLPHSSFRSNRHPHTPPR